MTDINTASQIKREDITELPVYESKFWNVKLVYQKQSTYVSQINNNLGNYKFNGDRRGTVDTNIYNSLLISK